MSISSALNSAISGLSAASRASEIVSENLANVMTPGYVRRTLEVGSSADGIGGVTVLGVQRQSDPVILSERRATDAALGNAQVLADFHAGFSDLVGAVTDGNSIGSRLATFEASLIEAASTPESPQRLDAVAYAAQDLVSQINAASEGLQIMRTRSDSAIGAQVDHLNSTLQNVQTLNARISAAQTNGGDTSAMLDQRQSAIDEINSIVPINIAQRDNGQIALYTDGGAILIDGPAAQLTFDAARMTVPDMTLEGGGLSGLTINGVPVSEKSIAGGTLAAHFQVRDDLSVSAQAELDAVAADLIMRFEAAGLDPTVATGEAGLFTDDGAPFDAARITGLASRLSLNDAINPSANGESWRLRSGLGAASAGETGNSRQLQAFANVLLEGRIPLSSEFGTGLMAAADIATALMSNAVQNTNRSESVLSFASASQSEMATLEAEQGVDTDEELQHLMIVERAYAANARMLQTIDEMMETLLGI